MVIFCLLDKFTITLVKKNSLISQLKLVIFRSVSDVFLFVPDQFALNEFYSCRTNRCKSMCEKKKENRQRLQWHGPKNSFKFRSLN